MASFNELIQCRIKAITGFNCPGCGGTRMVLSALHGDLYQAFRYNPWMFITIPILLFTWLTLFNRNRKLLVRIMQVYCYSTIIFGVLRNIPVFSFLAPTVIY